MGSYSVEERLIRIHRSLDRAFVPRFFVEWIVFHEMLHQVHDIKVKNGRREFHSKAFLDAEAGFDRYVEARAWERAQPRRAAHVLASRRSTRSGWWGSPSSASAIHAGSGP
jgi:hypothetical protein